MARLVVVGSGTVVPEGDRGGACHYLEAAGCRVLLDCGPGAAQGLARLRLPWADLTDLVISHFHADHVGALPGLFFGLKHGLWPEAREAPLDVWGPPGTKALFEGLARALGDFLLDPGFPVRIRDLEPGDEAELEGGLRLRTRKTPHTEESQAVRLEDADLAIGYTGDTGPDPSLGEWLAGTTILLCECSLSDEQAVDIHLSPTSVAELAGRARPARLVLTHIYPHFRTHDVAGLVRAAGYEGTGIEVAYDGLSLPLAG